MINDNLKNTLSAFGIELKGQRKKYVKNYLTPLYDRYNSDNFVEEDIQTKYVINAEMPEEFVELLYIVLKEISYSCYKNDIDFRDLISTGIVEILIEKFEKDYKDEYLQKKYPELKEIMDEYELKKKLIVDHDDM